METKYFNDYEKAKEYAKKHGLVECEYGDTGYYTYIDGKKTEISYCAWNKSGKREDDWEIEADYTWKQDEDGRNRPCPIGKDWIKETYGVEAE